MVACVEEDRVRLARSHSVLRRRTARWFLVKSLPRFFRFEILDAEVHSSVVEVLASQMRVTGRRLHLADAVLDREERDVKSTATRVLDQNFPLTVTFFQSVSDGCRGRLVDDPQHSQTGDGPRILGCLALRIVEVCGAQSRLCRSPSCPNTLQQSPYLPEHHGRHLLWMELLSLLHKLHLYHRLVTRTGKDLEGPQFHV